MSTFMLLALLCAFLCGMTAGAWLSDITMRVNDAVWHVKAEERPVRARPGVRFGLMRALLEPTNANPGKDAAGGFGLLQTASVGSAALDLSSA
jgi:hypothetical protein